VILTDDQAREANESIGAAIDLGLQAWRKTEAAETFRDAQRKRAVLLASHEEQARAIRELQTMVAWRDGLLTEIEAKPHRAEEVAARWRAALAGDTEQGEAES
jgi:hypothetical protein